MTEPSTRRTADTTAPIHPLLDERWSPRSYDASAEIDDATFTALLEAARWAPSAGNGQPRRFIAGRRGTPTFDAILANLLGFNSAWAGTAAALIVAVTDTDPEQGLHRWAEYDLGQSLAHLSVQAHASGLHVHQMGGFDPEGLRAAFALADSQTAVTVTAVGVVADAELLDEKTRERELAPRTRLPLDEVVLRAE